MEYLDEQTIKKIIEPYDMTLLMRSGDESKMPREAYEYTFYDNMNINIQIDPKDTTFKFTYVVDRIYQLTSGTMAPVTNDVHFKWMYDKFCNTVAKIKTVCN